METIKSILQNIKVTVSDLTPVSQESDKPSCNICQDTGWVYSKENGIVNYSKLARCVCKKEIDEKEKRSVMLKFCCLPTGDIKTFENYNTYGEDKLIKTLELSRNIGTESLTFLTLIGESDRGKSHLAQAVCRYWLEHGKPSRYVKAAEMMDELYAFDLQGENSYRQKLYFYKNVPMLALDDLCRAKVTEWAAGAIQEIIDYRYDNRFPLLITTNRPLDDIFNAKDYQRDEWRELANMRLKSRLTRENWCKVVNLNVQEHSKRNS